MIHLDKPIQPPVLYTENPKLKNVWKWTFRCDRCHELTITLKPSEGPYQKQNPVGCPHCDRKEIEKCLNPKTTSSPSPTDNSSPSERVPPLPPSPTTKPSPAESKSSKTRSRRRKARSTSSK